MRVTTALNRILGLRATWVSALRVEPDTLTVTVRLARRNLVCPECGHRTRHRFDTRPTPSRWRHLDLAGRVCVIECGLRRLRCPAHGVRTEAVPFARPGSGFTHDYETLVTWCAGSMDWTAVAVLCRIAWRTVRSIVTRTVPAPDLSALNPTRIGIDEISYKRGHKYLTLVLDHDTGRVIWGAKDRTAVALAAFFDQLGATKTAAITAVSMDFGAPYARAVRERAPKAAICLDPFHAVAMATTALDETRRSLWREMRTIDPDRAARFKATRWVLLKNPGDLTDEQARTLRRIKRAGGGIWRAHQLKEALREIYAGHTLSLEESISLMEAWIARAQRSRLPAFVKLATTLRTRIDEVANTWVHGITNARNEGTHSKIRGITARAHGYHTAASALAVINLTCGPTPLPDPHPATTNTAP